MEFDETFKVLMVGDSGVGKSSILMRSTDNVFEPMQPTIGVDFKVKTFNMDNRRVKMTIWDTAGQERFRTLTSAYYRGAHGVVLVYDVSNRQTFESLQQVWLKEFELYSTRTSAVKMVVGNKVDMPGRQVSREEGLEFARKHSTLFVESSAKTAAGVQQTFDELLRKILETPDLCTSDSAANGSVRPNATASSYADSCSC